MEREGGREEGREGAVTWTVLVDATTIRVSQTFRSQRKRGAGQCFWEMSRLMGDLS